MTLSISFNQVSEHTTVNNGFGYARKMCEESLRRLGHDVQFSNPDADLEINFIQPDIAIWSGVDYRICYVPWESTKMPDSWMPLMNEADEVWTPSPLIKEWFIDAGVTKPIEIYEHGVEDIWTPQFRTVEDDERIKFLHVGGEALRKGGNLTINTYLSAFGDKHVQLILKLMLDDFFNIHDTDEVAIIKHSLPIQELIALYHRAHMMVYPSWGEGFGLNPLQAMATGMPVLITKGWAPYQDLLGDHNLIDSTLTDSPWQDVHPGQMFEPHQDDMKDKWLELYENYPKYAKEAYDLSKVVRARYDWDTLTEKAFKKFE